MIYVISDKKTQERILHPEVKSISIKQAIENLSKAVEIGIDSETTGLCPHKDKLLIFQISDGQDEYLIDCLTQPIILFKELLESKNLIIQNAKFDLKFLFKEEIFPFKNVYDTFIVERLISLGIDTHKKSLDALCQRYLGISLPKTIRTNIQRLTITNSRVIEYSANDVRYLHEIKRRQLEIVKSQKIEKAVELENQFTTVLAYSEYCGMYLNRETWIEKSNKDLEDLKIKKLTLDKMVEKLKDKKFLNPPDLFNPNYTCKINWASSEQVLPLFKKLGLNLTTIDKKTKKSKESIEEKIIISQQEKHPIIKAYIEYSKASKLVSTYGLSFLEYINPVTNRVHTNYTQLMNTGRLSSSNPNLQNIPRKQGKERIHFIPEEGNTFIVADYSGQETRVLADASQDPDYLAYATDPSLDLHSFCTTLLYPELAGATVKEIKAYHSEKREQAKKISFAIPYGGNGATIAMNLGLAIKIGESIYDGFMGKFPKLSNYFETTKEKTVEQGYVLISTKTNKKCYFSYYASFLNLKKELEESVVTNIKKRRKSLSYFKGLSSDFWDYYKINKEEGTALFTDLKSKVSKYFQYLSSMEKRGLNYPIQGTAAEMTKLASILFFEYLLTNNLLSVVKIVGFVHDEIIIELPTNIADDVSDALTSCMIEAGKFFCPSVDIKLSTNKGLWSH